MLVLNQSVITNSYSWMGRSGAYTGHVQRLSVQIVKVKYEIGMFSGVCIRMHWKGDEENSVRLSGTVLAAR